MHNCLMLKLAFMNFANVRVIWHESNHVSMLLLLCSFHDRLDASHLSPKRCGSLSHQRGADLCMTKELRIGTPAPSSFGAAPKPSGLFGSIPAPDLAVCLGRH